MPHLQARKFYTIHCKHTVRLRFNQLGQSLLLKNIALSLIAAVFLGGCASPNSHERMEMEAMKASPHPAAFAPQGFFLDERSPPDRQTEQQEFYFKNCERQSKRRFPSRAEYDCNEK